MNRPSLHRQTLLPVLFLMLSTVTVRAQNELVAADDAVQLRRVWTVQGEHLKADEYGRNVWGGVDLTGDGIGDFGVYRGSDNTWLFYAGGNPPSSEPFWSMDSVGSVRPDIGEYKGDGRRYMIFRDGYEEIIDGFSYFYDRVRLFEVGATGVSTDVFMEEDQGQREPPVERFLRDFFVLNVNGDESDDLAVSLGGLRTGHVRTSDLTRQVWFYMGGDGFDLSEPDVIVADSGEYGRPDNWEVRFADFDGDGRTDMVMGGSYPEGGSMLRFYWGDENSPWSWAEREPDRDLQLIHGEIGINSIVSMGIYDVNGDGAADIGSYEYEEVEGSRIYMSGPEKNARTRSYSIEDADYYVRGSEVRAVQSGYLNDRSRTYETVLFHRSFGGSLGFVVVSGSAYGPDHDYEAWYAAGLDGLLNENISPVVVAADVTGDGYDDQIHAGYKYGPFVNTGIAIVLAGGPYIPFDDTTVSVREYPVAGESGGLYLWPNPVVGDELHIAWRGDLRRLPSEFAVYDVEGREVISGEVQSWRGSALWRCASVPSGCYVVVLRDAEGRAIATAPVVKH